MNGRKAKQLRRAAIESAYEYYKTLLTEEQAEELTVKQTMEFIPACMYVDVNPPMAKSEYSRVRVQSEYTMRWFIIQEKKRELRLR